MKDTLDFDQLGMGTICLPVTFGGKSYVLKEASEAGAVRYSNHRLKDSHMEGERLILSMDRVNESHSVLVSECLWDGDKQVPVEILNSWPSRVTRKLFNQAEEISELGRDDEESLVKQIEVLQKQLTRLRAEKGDPSKNALESTTPGSDSLTS
jgi:hypothetical protein